MKKILLAILSVVLITTLSSGQDTLQSPSTSLPSADLKTLDGRIINSRDILSDTIPIVLSFWATWCKPCIKELTAINDEMEDWYEEINFRVVAISIDDARTSHAVKNIVNAKGWEFEIYQDENSTFKKLMNVSQPPHTFIIHKGEIVYQHTSYAEGDEEELYEQLEKHQ